jgi:hypothetical protein
LNGDLRGLEIARFADHDAVRICRRKARNAGKRQPDVLLIGTWMMPSMSYSTGSSAVSTFESIVYFVEAA